MKHSKGYIEKGICIWCGGTIPGVTFYNEPHILPKSLGGTQIGFDICDECNKYFGEARDGKPNTNLVFKEVFNCIKLFSNNRDGNSYKKFSSVYFNYWHKENRIVLCKQFSVNTITQQFKRSLYEVFLQKYHSETKLGLEQQMYSVREFARFGRGNLKVYYIFNKVILRCDDIMHFTMTPKAIKDINDYGYYILLFMGHHFIMEINPIWASITAPLFLKNCVDKLTIKVDGNQGIFELKDIRDIDFFMERWGRKDIDIRNNLFR